MKVQKKDSFTSEEKEEQHNNTFVNCVMGVMIFIFIYFALGPSAGVLYMAFKEDTDSKAKYYEFSSDNPLNVYYELTDSTIITRQLPYCEVKYTANRLKDYQDYWQQTGMLK